MSANFRPYLGVTLALALVGACGLQGSEGGGTDAEDTLSNTGETPAQHAKADDSDGQGSASKAPAKEPQTTDDLGVPTQKLEGTCCPTGDCLCHGDPPLFLGDGSGPYWYESYDIGSGTVFYPSNADPPFAGVAIIPGFLNIGPEMTSWGWFYASWGIVTVVTGSSPIDIPQIRGGLLAGAIEELQGENLNPLSPLFGKMAGRYGTSGYSMGGGGTTIAAQTDPSLRSSVALAPWGGAGLLTAVPSLLMCGSVDAVAPCDMAWGVYGEIPDLTPKMYVEFAASDHLVSWFGPGDSGGGMAGGKALAFQKVYLEGDERWKDLLLAPPGIGTDQITNIFF